MAVTHLSAVVGGKTRCWVLGWQASRLCCGYSTLPWHWKSAVDSEDHTEQRYVSTTAAPSVTSTVGGWAVGTGCWPLQKKQLSVRDEFYQLINTKDSEGQELEERSCDFFPQHLRLKVSATEVSRLNRMRLSLRCKANTTKWVTAPPCGYTSSQMSSRALELRGKQCYRGRKSGDCIE